MITAPQEQQVPECVFRTQGHRHIPAEKVVHIQRDFQSVLPGKDGMIVPRQHSRCRQRIGITQLRLHRCAEGTNPGGDLKVFPHLVQEHNIRAETAVRLVFRQFLTGIAEVHASAQSLRKTVSDAGTRQVIAWCGAFSVGPAHRKAELFVHPDAHPEIRMMGRISVRSPMLIRESCVNGIAAKRDDSRIPERSPRHSRRRGGPGSRHGKGFRIPVDPDEGHGIALSPEHEGGTQEGGKKKKSNPVHRQVFTVKNLCRTFQEGFPARARGSTKI